MFYRYVYSFKYEICVSVLLSFILIQKKFDSLILFILYWYSQTRGKRESSFTDLPQLVGVSRVEGPHFEANWRNVNSCEGTYLLSVSQGIWRSQSAPDGEVATDTQFTATAQAWSTFVLNKNALALNMQGKAYTKEIDAENWTVSMDFYHQILSSVLMPELQWLSW